MSNWEWNFSLWAHGLVHNIKKKENTIFKPKQDWDQSDSLVYGLIEQLCDWHTLNNSCQQSKLGLESKRTYKCSGCKENHVQLARATCLSLADRQVHIQVLHKTLWACKDYFMGLVVGMPLGRLHHSYTLLKLQARKLVFLTYRYMPWCWCNVASRWLGGNKSNQWQP